ncbi:MAG: hypothetical protein MK132_21435 [Lentisphaerales bacterium]|nr:hypothetical protein [Lentisphaerales bacterium]
MAYITLGKLDGLMHHIGKTGQKVDELMDWYDGQIRELYACAEEKYEEVSLCIQ